VDARESILKMLQDRSLSIHHRMALALAISHDMQAHVDRREMFSCEDIPKKYESETARKYTKERLETFEKDEAGRFEFAQKAFQYLYRLELLKENWLYVLMDADKLLYGGLASVYEDSVKSDAEQKGNTAQKGGEEQSEEDIDQLRYFVNLQEFELWKQEHMSDWDIMLEQMLVYFVFTYFCGAVYDGRIQAKMQVCVYSVYIIEEILRARWLENEKTLSMEEVVELTYRYSREVEHSDQNPERLEHFMEKNPWIRVKK
jgi:lysine-N-methylase